MSAPAGLHHHRGRPCHRIGDEPSEREGKRERESSWSPGSVSQRRALMTPYDISMTLPRPLPTRTSLAFFSSVSARALHSPPSSSCCPLLAGRRSLLAPGLQLPSSFSSSSRLSLSVFVPSSHLSLSPPSNSLKNKSEPNKETPSVSWKHSVNSLFQCRFAASLVSFSPALRLSSTPPPISLSEDFSCTILLNYLPRPFSTSSLSLSSISVINNGWIRPTFVLLAVRERINSANWLDGEANKHIETHLDTRRHTEPLSSEMPR